MSTITLRSVKNAPLSNTEVDNNFTNLNTDKLELGGTYSGGTANGVPYLNGSKVLTSGSALTFDGSTFYISGVGTIADIRLASTGYIKGGSNVGDTRILANRFRLYDLAGTQLSYNLASTGEQTWYVGGSERMRLTSTGLGIGTSSPTLKLDVNGSAKFAGNYVSFNDTGYIRTDAPTIMRFQHGNGGYEFRNAGNSDNLLKLDSSGNLGLGVTPSAWGGSYKAFQIGNRAIAQTGAGAGDWTMAFNAFYDSADNRWEYIYTGDSAVRYSQTGAGIHAWYTAPSGTAGNAISFSQVMTLDASGNLGLGTTSPNNGGHNGRWLTLSAVAGSTYSGGLSFAIGGTNQCWLYQDTDNLMAFQGAGSNAGFKWKDGATERARITSSGDLLVGTTSNAGFGGSVIESSTANANPLLVRHAESTGVYGQFIQFSNAAPNNATNYFLQVQDSAALRAQIRSNGGIANYQANDSNLSDRREKTNFAPAGEYLSKICAIPVQTFNYIDQNMEDDPGLTLGVVAQDVQSVAPELVMESNWGTEDEPKMRLSIYQTDLQYALMKCIQEQQALIESLESRLAAAGL